MPQLLQLFLVHLFFLSNLDHDKKLNLQQAFLLTALSWLSIAIFGSLPLMFFLKSIFRLQMHFLRVCQELQQLVQQSFQT